MAAVTTLRARYVFPVVGEPIKDGFVTIAGEQIVAVGRCGGGVPFASSLAGETPASQRTLDLGNVAILPGLINAHAHLDFSRLEGPLGHRGIALPDWIRLVMEYRRTAAEELSLAVADGLRESARSGVTTLADIVQPNQPIAQSPLDVTGFLELIGPTAERVAVAVEAAQLHIKAARSRPVWAESHAYVAAGLSPHAPYSVHPDLLAAIVKLSASESVPVAMHLAESLEELTLLRDGTGPFRMLLDELGAVDRCRRTTSRATPVRPIDYLKVLAAAHRALIIHGNYLDDAEIAFLGANAGRMSVVYCPRSHDWFGHRSYPLERMLAAGVTVALGTDGRCSTRDLSVLAEMRFVVRQHPGVPLDRILRLGTIQGAKALGCEDEVGSLAPGKRADLAIVALPDREATEPHELVFNSDRPVVACYCRGQRIVGHDRLVPSP